ncbi:MAG: peptidylprolyl isomerase [Candidatus Eisenbacteria bacterium]|nr:peptidylprolyl isomerase [Candidatus Eisenbacteria bacterium]
MSKANTGDTVRVRYRGTLEDGTEFDASEEKKPFELTLGAGRVIPGFEKALLGMEAGERKIVRIPPEEAYGRYREALRLRVHRETLGEGASFRAGQEVRIRRKGETTLIGRVLEIAEEAIVVDANHPLAGRALTFEIELVEIV